MTIVKKMIRSIAEVKVNEFNDMKKFLSRISGLYSYVDNYIIAYSLLKECGYNVTKINNVKIDTEKDKVFIEFESKVND